MKVDVIEATRSPLYIVSKVAGMSRGASDYKAGRIARCIERRHDSVLECVTATFRVRGISRACSHQLVRHRLASFVERSQRYTRVDVSENDWFVRPESFDTSELSDASYHYLMGYAGGAYVSAIENGIPVEDARYMLPAATKTDIMVTVNLRELDHMRDERCTAAAQWEIRAVVCAMWDALRCNADGYGELLGMLDARRLACAAGDDDGAVR